MIAEPRNPADAHATPPPTDRGADRPMTAARPRVVVIGCGFGGLEAVRALSKAPVEIVLIDRTNHHLFQPLLYQVATAGLTAPAVSASIRHALRKEMRRGNLTILQGEVRNIDPASRRVVLDDPEGQGVGASLDYDHLIVATGSTSSYFGHADWPAHAPGLKTLADGFAVRSRFIGAFEQAERCGDAAAAQRDAWLTFVVIGGGPTGVELAGTMIEIAHHTLRDEFRRIDPLRTHVVLIEGSDRILGAFVPKLSQRAADQLARLGVDLRTGCKVTAIDAAGVSYETSGPDGVRTHRLASRTVIWAAGVTGSPLGRALAVATGTQVDRGGRVAVEPDLSLPGHPEISVVGDLAAALSHGAGTPTPVPGVSPAAKQMGRTAAANLLRRLRGEPTRPFRYSDYGNLATVGRKAAVVELVVPGIGALRFSGFAAWLFWLFAHIYFLIGFRNRLTVMVDWAWAYATYERSARVVAEPPSREAAPHG
jgi:NADH dehydrogenase